MAIGLAPGFGQNFSSANRFGIVDSFYITEASGLAASRQNPGVLWTHNDNGYAGSIFAISTNGSYLGRYFLPNVFSGDFEDIAMGPGPLPEFQYIYLGDIGDNLATRTFVRVFRFPEPAAYTNQASHPWLSSAVRAEEIRLRYPDGPFNAEALMVDPLTGDLFIATKLTNSSRIYRASRAQLDSGMEVPMSFVREISFFKVAGGDISPDGRLIALRRGGTAWVWNRSLSQSVGDALGAAGKSIPLANEENGEAIAFHQTGLGYFTLSEGIGQTNYYYRRTDSGVQRQPVVLVPPGSVWRYNDSGTDLGEGWPVLNFNDAGWSEGAGQFGYGQGDERTVVSFGFDDFNKNPTTYFRKRFNIASLTSLTNVALRLCYNDGVAVYVNGTEVLRSRLIPGASYADAALGSGQEFQNVWQSVAISPSLLRTGTNIVAVEVHRYLPWESELSFDLQVLESAVESAARFVPPLGIVNGKWQVHVSGPTGSTAVIEASDDLSIWSRAGEVVLTGGLGTFVDPLPAGTANRFYRIKR